MYKKNRNTYLGAAMFMEHVGLLCPGVVAIANVVARQDGTEIPLEIEESLTSEDKREIAKAAALTALLGQQRTPTELERLVMLQVVNSTVQRDFLPVTAAFPVMYELFGMEPRDAAGYTLENWQSSLDSVVGFPWPTIESQLAKLRNKANKIVSRADDALQHELADGRVYWEQILQRHLDYAAGAVKPSFDDSLAIYAAAADVAWAYKVEIATARPLF